MVEKCIKEFLENKLTPKPVVSTVPKKHLVISLPYLGKLFLQIPTRINRIMKNTEKLQRGSCNATYYGKTKCHFEVRMCKLLGIFALTAKRVNVDDDSAIKEHLLFCNHAPNLENFSILTTNNNDFKVTLMGSLLIS